jgi:hypothetical protein
MLAHDDPFALGQKKKISSQLTEGDADSRPILFAWPVCTRH